MIATLGRLRQWLWPPLPWPPGRWLIVAGLAVLTLPVGPVVLGAALAISLLRPNPVRRLFRWLWPPRPWPLGRHLVLAGLAIAASAPLGVLIAIIWGGMGLVRRDMVQLVAAGIVLVATVLAVGWVTRSVRLPLEALGRATERIAAGDLAFELPAPQVAEVHQLALRFDAMRAGLQAAIERQAEAERQRMELVASISHDLRTPVTSVRGYLEGLRDGVARSPEQVSHYVEVALDKAGVLERLINDLFDYTRLEYAAELARMEPLDIGAFLQTVVAGFAPRAAAGQVNLVLAAGPAVQAAADPTLLERAVANLLDNALRHTPNGGHVSVSWTGVNGTVTVTVTDSGAGIPPEDLPHIFEPLYRGEKSRSRRTGGAGLGLSIARRIARVHGGELAATNGAGGGACFVLSLPAWTGPAEPAATSPQEIDLPATNMA